MTPAQIRSAVYCALISESINKATARASRMRPSTVLADHGAGASAEPPYGPMCRNRDACAGKGYCPLDPTCGD